MDKLTPDPLPKYTVFEPATLGRILDVLLRIEAQFSLMAKLADRWESEGMPSTRSGDDQV
jgi:hypothetical protein